MFSALRPNNILYVLNKKDSPTLRKMQVVSVSAPMPKVQGMYSNPMDTTVDITVKDSNGQEVFKNIPSSLGTANDGTIILTETKEAMCSEVEAMITVSRQIIDSVPYHKNILEKGDELLKELNPQFAKEKEQEAKISALETKIGGIESSIGDMKQMLAQALNKA